MTTGNFRTTWTTGEVAFIINPDCPEDKWYTKRVHYKGKPEEYAGHVFSLGKLFKLVVYLWH